MSQRANVRKVECVYNIMLLCSFLYVFIAHQQTDARYWYSNSVCLSVRLSVCPWRSGIRWKRLNILSFFTIHSNHTQSF